jgi:hypothetical protein
MFDEVLFREVFPENAYVQNTLFLYTDQTDTCR